MTTIQLFNERYVNLLEDW